ncbi:MAG: hypothetical protein AAF360_16570 [Pseudomonadota bacterium]
MGESTRRGIVAALKIGLPLTALGVFASLFLLSNARYADGVSFEGVDLSALEDGLRLVNPRFTGATNRGEPFSVTAAWALPDGPRPERVELSQVAGEISLADGRVVTLSADAGVLEPKANVLTLTEGAHFTSSDGYDVSAVFARLDADADELTAKGGVTAIGPLGRITSDDMRATRAATPGDKGGKDAYIWFENRVKVRIDSARMARDRG